MHFGLPVREAEDDHVRAVVFEVDPGGNTVVVQILHLPGTIDRCRCSIIDVGQPIAFVRGVGDHGKDENRGGSCCPHTSCLKDCQVLSLPLKEAVKISGMKTERDEKGDEDKEGIAQGTAFEREANNPQVDAEDVDHDGKEQKDTHEGGSSEAKQCGSHDLDPCHNGRVDGGIAEVVPGEPEAGDISHWLCKLGVEDGELRAHHLGKAVPQQGEGGVITSCEIEQCRQLANDLRPGVSGQESHSAIILLSSEAASIRRSLTRGAWW